jgi:hypothetical protein
VEAVLSRVPYDRVWANIVAERACRSESSTWLDLMDVGRRAMPAMVMVALALTAWRWMSGTGAIRSMPNASDFSLERVALSGSAVSDDEVLTVVMNWPLRDRSRMGGPR